MNNKDAQISIRDDNFDANMTFFDIVPVTDDTEAAYAVQLKANVERIMSSRTRVYMRLLNLIARRGTDAHWKELDVCLTTMAAILEETGLDGAIECLTQEITQSPSSSDESNSID